MKNFIFVSLILFGIWGCGPSAEERAAMEALPKKEATIKINFENGTKDTIFVQYSGILTLEYHDLVDRNSVNRTTVAYNVNSFSILNSN